MRFRTAPNSLEQAQVIAPSPPGRLICLIPQWGTGTRVTVRFSTGGQADGLRTRQRPMPRPGTWGVVGFLNGDSRNGVWLGSFDAALTSALMVNPENDQDPDVTYDSEASGYWRYRDQTGGETTTYPDGTQIVVSPSGSAVQPTRTIVEGQAPKRIPYEQSDRASIKSPFTIKLTMPSGLTVQLQGDTMTVLAGSIQLTGNVDVTGNLQVSGNIS